MLQSIKILLQIQVFYLIIIFIFLYKILHFLHILPKYTELYTILYRILLLKMIKTPEKRRNFGFSRRIILIQSVKQAE